SCWPPHRPLRSRRKGRTAAASPRRMRPHRTPRRPMPSRPIRTRCGAAVSPSGRRTPPTAPTSAATTSPRSTSRRRRPLSAAPPAEGPAGGRVAPPDAAAPDAAAPDAVAPDPDAVRRSRFSERPSDAAYGAYQRGYYITALNLATPLALEGDAAAQTLIAEIY